ncbi:maleylacetoacetate isomerase [Niveispirillum sp. KHB5.9]|uniref:maleylacetoacetate isomerase n=1 Tax=Niveispirillum sp. KHB5.9 TaxID=3400269 RepID=UPI003A8A6108
MMQLHTYFRSSAAYRVRIALALKGIQWDPAYVHLLKDGGQQRHEAYRDLNPQGLVPTLVDGDAVIPQSLAILEYLEERQPTPPLLPADPAGRAKVRAMALAVVADIHPLNNLRVLNYLRGSLGLGDEAVKAWIAHWVAEGFTALEQMVEGPDFCLGHAPSFADLCLVPQMFNARRFGVDLTAYPKLVAIDAHCQTLDAFQVAAPGHQGDAE